MVRASINFLHFEPPSVRQARLRDTTRRLTGEVLEFNELLEENLRRFQEVERRQETPFRLAPSTTQLPPEFQRPLEERGGRGLAGFAASQFEQAEREVFGPIAALGLQTVESPIGAALPFVPELKTLQRKTEDIGVPEDVSPLPRTRTFEEIGEPVNPIVAILGSEEEQDKAQAVLEEAGLPRAMAARVIFDLANLLPGAGIIKVDDALRLGRLVINATRAAPKARTAAVTTLRESGQLQKILRTVSEEAGARPLRGGEEGLSIPQRIHKLHNRLARDWDLEKLGPKVLGPEDVAPIAKQRVIAEFGEDPTITLYRGIGVDELPPAYGKREGIGEFWSTSVERAEHYARGGRMYRVEVKASELVDPVGGPVGLRATRAGDEFVLPQEIQNRATQLSAPPLRGGERVFPEEITPARVGDETAFDNHIIKADPGPPPRKPPREPPRGPSPDDPEFDDILEAALKGEKPGETLVRRHQGAVNTATRIAANEAEDANNLLMKAGLGRRFRQSVVAKEEGAFDELNSLLHNPSKVTSGELTVPEHLRPIYNKLREVTDWEQAARVDFDPDMALVEDYFFRGWQPPEGMFTGEARGALGRNPAFRLPRVNATFDEMTEAGFKPLFENPAEQARYSRLMGIKYREQMKLIDKIKASELALPHTGGTVPEGWRVPKVGPAFEGKPYAAPGGGVSFTRRWAVPDSLANRLENVYGVTPKLGKGEIFGKTVDFQKLVDAAVFLPKRAKLIGSVFQHVDFLGRSHVGAWTGFVDAIRRGQPVAAVAHLAKWPKSAIDIIHSTFSPGFRSRLSRLAVDDTPLWKGRKISNKMISQEGLSLRDETIFPELDKVIAEVRNEPRIVAMGKAPIRLLGDLERSWRNGLFKGVYPAAVLSDIKNNIGPMIMRQHPDLSDRQLAGMIAKQANASYSTIPAGMSVVQNQQARWFLTRFLFSLNEQEGLLRAFTGAIRGENAAYFRTRLLGTYLGVMGLASVIHFATTGEPLPFDRFTPISKDKWGPLPFGYNTNFAAPNIPLTGRSGTQVTIDLMGQMDTAFRTLDPKSFLSSRYSVPVRAAVSQATERDFFGAPIDTVGPGGVFSRTAQLTQDLFAPIGPGQAGLELLRSNIEEVEGLIQPGEARLGTAGLGVQATGVNLRAETTPQLLDRIRGEVMREKGIEGSYEDIKATDSPLADEIDNEVEVRIGQELELRSETAKLRGQVTPQGEGFGAIEATRGVQETEQLADDAKLNSGQWAGDAWREGFRDRQRDFFNRREQIKADFQIEFDDKEAPSGSVNAAIDAYFNVNVDDFGQPDGTTDWDGFFEAQDAALVSLSSTDRKRVMGFIRKFDTPTVTEFRKAQDIMDRFFETPKYVGLSLKQGKEVDRVLFELAPALQTRFEAQTGEALTRKDAVRHLAAVIRDKEAREFLLEHFGGGVQAGLRRIGAGGGLRRITDVRRETDEIRNEKRDQILIDNEVILARFYNDVLERELSREQEAGLLPTTLEALFGPAMTLPDIERRGLRRITAGR